jgi:two-component system chemotaxis response regulator CheB
MRKIKALIVDDSALIRTLLTQILSETPDIEVVGTASDPYVARDKIKQLNPDVLTLDVEMPRMDGLTFLRNLMRLRPMPVVMLSSLTQEGAETTLQALAYGAVDFVQKPQSDLSQSLPAYADEIVSKVRAAARCRILAVTSEHDGGPAGQAPAKSGAGPGPAPKDLVIAIGASTGGTEAIKQVVKDLPPETPPIVISQHLPLPFSKSFAAHVDKVSRMRAQVAEDKQPMQPGNIYIAPGNRHLLIRRLAPRSYLIDLDDGPPVNRHKPSVDVMFRSVAEAAGSKSIGVILTGMGADGAAGLKQMHDAGAATIGQDESTSVVWGMPGEAYKLGGIDHLTPLQKITGKLLELVNGRQ